MTFARVYAQWRPEGPYASAAFVYVKGDDDIPGVELGSPLCCADWLQVLGLDPNGWLRMDIHDSYPGEGTLCLEYEGEYCEPGCPCEGPEELCYPHAYRLWVPGKDDAIVPEVFSALVELHTYYSSKGRIYFSLTQARTLEELE
jgi:hypothetical protein